MKLIKIQTTILLGLIFLNSTKVIAQGSCASGSPWCTAGNSIVNGDVLGGDGSNTLPLYIQTNGTTRVTVAGNSNNVGIGTTSPSNLVHMYNSGAAAELYLQWSNGHTTHTLGMTAGVNTANEGVINMKDNRPINFLTDDTRRMRLTAGGYLLIGNYNSFTVNNQLVQYAGSNTSTYHQFVASNSSTAATDGFRIGITNNSGTMDAELRQGANAPVNILTNGTQRMTITGAGNVGIGTTTPAALLDVTTSPSTASVTNTTQNISLTNSGINCNNYGSNINVTANATGCSSVGQFVLVSCGANNNSCTGGSFTAGAGTYTGTSSFGIIASAQQGTDDFAVEATAQYGTNDVYGVKARANGNASSSHYVHAVHAEANANGGTHTQIYGVYASGGSACTSTSCTNAAGYFSGDVVVTGELYETSDAFLKDNVQPISNAGNIINQLNPCTYNFKNQDYPSLHLSEANINYGLIADSVALILPELVKGFSESLVKDSNGVIIHPQVDFKAVNYTALIPILIAAVKEQQAQIQALQANPKPANPGLGNQLKVNLSDKATIVLEQNLPNPWKESTTINYNIPLGVKQAQLLFYNSKGNVISTVEITEKGAGSLLVYGADLTNGVYTYTLLIDGRAVETRKMMKIK